MTDPQPPSTTPCDHSSLSCPRSHAANSETVPSNVLVGWRGACRVFGCVLWQNKHVTTWGSTRATCRDFSESFLVIGQRMTKELSLRGGRASRALEAFIGCQCPCLCFAAAVTFNLFSLRFNMLWISQCAGRQVKQQRMCCYSHVAFSASVSLSEVRRLSRF